VQGTLMSQAKTFLRLSNGSLGEKKFHGRIIEYAGLFQELELLDPAWVYESVSAGVKKDCGGRYRSQWGGPSSDVATTAPELYESVSAGVKKELEGRYLSQWGGPNSDVATTAPELHRSQCECEDELIELRTEPDSDSISEHAISGAVTPIHPTNYVTNRPQILSPAVEESKRTLSFPPM
jgi:hypothetical protein